MTPNSKTAEAAAPATVAVQRLMWYFAFVYIAEGLAQVSGIIHQPLNYFLKEALGWKADAVTAYVAILGIPWVIKPLYGLLSDCVPLFGYRRRSYLILVNAVAVLAFLALSITVEPSKIIVALFMITTAMAASSALCGALLVEHGKSSGLASKFCAVQSLFVNIANVTAALIGGYLCQVLSPTAALHTAAVVSVVAPLLVVATTKPLVTESKARADFAQLKAAGSGVLQALKSKSLWGIAAFLACWAFNPGFGTPLYYHMKDHLHFSQTFMGSLSAVFAIGAAAGALLYMKVLAARFSVKSLACACILLGALTQAVFIFMSGTTDALILHFFNGAATAMAMLNAHVIAANKCPDKAEGFMYAILLSVTNLSYFLSQGLGGHLYVSVFDGAINPLILLSAAMTACCLLLVPFFNFERTPAQGGETKPYQP